MRLADIINFAPLVSLVFVSRILPLYLWVAVSNNETLRTIHLEAGLGSTGSICVISADADTPILHSIVRPISQCLDRSLRRLHLYGIDPSAVSFLGRALKSAAAPLPLTHLSLTSAEWTHLKRNCVLRLVRALRNLPDLRVLCLRGLQYAQPGLFRRIARDAPGLHALTVGHRVSILETNNPFYGARWPAPAYEYAKYLTGMHELRHLGVNMEILGRAYSPAGLLGIERRMSEPEVASSLDESDSEGELQESDDYLTRDSARHTAAMFAAYAPALESFFAGSEEDWVPMFSCTFNREDGSKRDDSVLGPQRENPPMKLYADDVYEAQNRYWHADLHLRVTKDDKDPEELEYAEERVQRAREFCEIVLGRAYTNRLFESLIGYHTGSLDLTGRHPPRYMKLCTQIVAMAMELFAMKDKVTISTREVLDWDFAQMKKVPCVEVVYDFEPPTLWDEFADKWHVKYSHDYGTLQRGVERCLSTIGAAKVRFQELLLTDLPPELLDYIISIASTEELAAWSGTCELLRDHALTYAYEEIKYLLDSVHTLDADLMEKLRKRKDGQEKANNYVRKVALRQRNATVNRMRHILRQKDALAKTKKIILYEDWTCDHWRWSELLGCSYNDFVGPLIKPLAQQIRLAPLTEFSYRSRSLYGLVWKAISQCPTLHTLTLLTSLPVSVQWPLATSVVNLALHMTEAYQPDFLWEIVTYCPSALYLGVFAPSRRGGTSIPRVVFGGNAYNPLTQLRRIELHGMDPGSIIVLAEAFVAAGLPPLTHFAISAPTNSHITREPVFALIRSLHNARQLQTLCISTLQYVQPDLFALIGENLPGLRLLALEHQPSKYREVRKGGTLWPRPSFEYAPHLAALPHLRHLGINISSYDLAYTPRAMHRLENGYDGAEDEDEHALNLLFSRSTEDVDLDMEDPRRIDRLGDSALRATARLFAVHGQGLQTMSLNTPSLLCPGSSWAVDRDAGGKVTLRESFTDEEQKFCHTAGAGFMRADWEFSEREMENIGSGSRSSPIELSDDEDMRAPVPKAQTLAVKAGRNNATRQASPATRSKSAAKRKREEEQPDAFVPRPPPKATTQAPASAPSQPKQKNKKKGSNKQQKASKQTQPPPNSSQPISKPTRTGHPQQVASHSGLALPPHMVPPHIVNPLMALFDTNPQSEWVNAMFTAAEGPSNPPIHHTLPQKPDVEMRDSMPSTSYIPPPAPAQSQRPAPSLQSPPPVTQARAKAPAPAPANIPAKKQKGRSMIGYDPDPDPKSAHGCVPSEALASLAPWTPDPERTLVMENIPKAYRNHPEWVSKWALSVCGVAPPIVVTNKVLRDKAIIEFPSNALAASAWRSKRLNPELDKLPPDLLKGQPRLDFIRVYWLVVDGESPGYHLAQRRQQEVKAQMPASEAGESSSSSAPAPKQSKKQKQKQKAEGQSQQQPTQPPPSLTPYTDAAPAQLPTRSRRPSLSLTPYTDAAFAVSHGQPVPPLSYTPYADAFFPRRAQAAAEGRDIWDDDLYAQALASLPSMSTPALPPPPLFNDYAAPDKPPHSQASRPSQRPLKPTHIPPRSPSPFAIGPPIDIDMSAMHRRASSSSADCVMISPVRSNPLQSTAAYPPVQSSAEYSPVRSTAAYPPVRPTATCSPADPIVIDVDEGEYEVDGREQSLEPGEIRMDYVPPPAPAKAPLPPTRAPLLPTPQKAAPVAASKAGPSKAGPSKAGPSKGSRGREPVPTAASSGKSTTAASSGKSTMAASSGKSTAAPPDEAMTTPSNTAVTPERMAMVQNKSEGMTQDESEGTTRLEDELKALVRQSRRMAPRAAPSHSTGPSSSHPTQTPSLQPTRPPSPPPQSSTSTSTTSLTSQSSQMSQKASSATVPQSASATGTQTATAMISQSATATMVRSAAATVDDDAEMFIKMAISEASTQPPSEELSSKTSAVQTSMPMAIEQKTQIFQTSSRTQLSQSWPPHASSGLPHASSRPPPANSRPPPSTDYERLGDHLNESKRLLAMLSAAKTKEEREHIVVLIKEMNRRYATAGAAAASSTQQYTVGQTPKPRRKWPAPEQGPVIIEISDDEVDEYDEGR
ncbi:hypothetical protein EV715DRAFT_264295 [Schizophyllum commune]